MADEIITVSLNPTIDRVMEVASFKLGAHQMSQEILRVPGGKAINVSRVVAELGVRNVATGFLGQQNRAEFNCVFEDTLVRDKFFALPGQTRENVTIVDPINQQETHVRDVGLAVDERNFDRLVNKLKLLVAPDTIIIFSGSLPPGIGPSNLAHLVMLCRKEGARVVVDTSGLAMQAMRGLPLWLIKPNQTELGDLLGRAVESRADQLATAR